MTQAPKEPVQSAPSSGSTPSDLCCQSAGRGDALDAVAAEIGGGAQHASTRNTEGANADNSRGEFEAFHAGRKNKGATYRETLFERREDGTYAEDSVQRHWWTWQRARAALQAPKSTERHLREALQFFVSHPGVSQLCTPNSEAMRNARAALAAPPSEPLPTDAASGACSHSNKTDGQA